MGKTVERMLQSFGLDSKTVVLTVEEDEDHKITVTISLLAVLLIFFISIFQSDCYRQWCISICDGGGAIVLCCWCFFIC